MKDNPLILTIDFGTQSVRTALVDKNGEIEALIKQGYDPIYVSTQAGYAEQDPNVYWDNCVKCLKALVNENKDKLDRIIASTITCFRDSSVQLDANNNPVRKCILWLDQRLAKGKEKLPWWHWVVYWLVGMTETIKLNRSRTVAHWLKENEKESWAKTKKYVNISTYLTYKLTGVLADSCSSYTGHYPINFRTGQWYTDYHLKAYIFGVSKKMMCELKKPGEIIGIIKEEIADITGLPKGLKVYASGSDKACETIGLGALSNTTAAISYGTASSIEVSNKKYHEPEKFLPAYPAATPGWYNMEVQVYRGYWMLKWFTQNFAKEINDKNTLMMNEQIFDSKLAEIPPGSDGLVLQPYWGPGLSRPLAKGAIVGFSDIHTREHLYRAIIEGIAYALKEGLESIEHSQHKKVKAIMISGGGSQNDDICQITADIFNLPVSRVQTFETTTLGAAMATFVAVGEFKDIEEAKEKMVHKSVTFEPDAYAAQQYSFLYKNVYLKMYPKLKHIYKDLNKFNKRY